MAYASTITYKPLSPKRLKVTIEETDCSSTDEVVMRRMPRNGKVLRVKSLLSSGDATKINPVLGTATDPGGVNVITEWTSDDDDKTTIDFMPGLTGADFDCAGVLYHRSVPDTGTNNVITTEYLIERT